MQRSQGQRTTQSRELSLRKPTPDSLYWSQPLGGNPRRLIFRIPRAVLPRRDIGAAIGSGTHSIIFKTRSRSSRVIRIGNARNDQGGFRTREIIKIARYMGKKKHRIGPTVYRTWHGIGMQKAMGKWKETYLSYIEQDRFDYTLRTVALQNLLSRPQRHKVYDKIKKLVAAMHKLGYVHGDLHNENVMLKVKMTKTKRRRRGHVRVMRVLDVRLIDFGAARKLTASKKHRELHKVKSLAWYLSV